MRRQEFDLKKEQKERKIKKEVVRRVSKSNKRISEVSENIVDNFIELRFRARLYDPKYLGMTAKKNYYYMQTAKRIDLLRNIIKYFQTNLFSFV